MKIGIGITAFNRPQSATICIQSILNTIDRQKYEYKIVCALDREDVTGYEEVAQMCELIPHKNLGISVNKSIALMNLQDCDYICLVEDDVKMIKSGWIDIYIQAIKESKIEMFNFYPSWASKPKKIISFPSCTVLFEPGHTAQVTFMTKAILDNLGALDPRYKGYGFEHVDYTRRWKKLTNRNMAEGDPMIKELHEYVQLIEVPTCLDKNSPTFINNFKHNSILFAKGSQRIKIPFSEIQRLL